MSGKTKLTSLHAHVITLEMVWKNLYRGRKEKGREIEKAGRRGERKNGKIKGQEKGRQGEKKMQPQTCKCSDATSLEVQWSCHSDL